MRDIVTQTALLRAADERNAIGIADRLRIVVHDRAAAIEPAWRTLEAVSPASVYQTFDWVDCWLATAALAQQIRPALVLMTLDDRSVGIWPLGIERIGPFRVARFLGGEHANIRMPLFDPVFAATLDAGSVERLFDRIGAAIGGVDLFDLDAMPVEWAGARNPLATHGTARPARCHVGSMALEANFQSVLKAHRGAKKTKKHRWQANALGPVGGFKLSRAGTEAEALQIVETYFDQKSAWFRSQGIADSFAAPGITDFFRALIRRRFENGAPVIDLDALEFDGGIRAILGSGASQGRLSGFFMSVADDDWRRVSPGELLLYEVVRASCALGLDALDLGRGDERYKTSWLDRIEAHVRLLVPVTPTGRMAAGLFRLSDFAERSIRENPRLWRFAKQVRRWRGGETAEPEAAE